jgi:hypothetical protein
MTPLSHTLFSVCLFLALSALLSWSTRRDRRISRCRIGGAALLRGDESGVL